MGGVCSDTDDAGEVGAEWEASGVSGGDEGYVRIAGVGIRIKWTKITRNFDNGFLQFKWLIGDARSFYAFKFMGFFCMYKL